MKKPNNPQSNGKPCEDGCGRKATRIYVDNDGNGIMLCQRCLEVRLLKEPTKDDEVII